MSNGAVLWSHLFCRRHVCVSGRVLSPTSSVTARETGRLRRCWRAGLTGTALSALSYHWWILRRAVGRCMIRKICRRAVTPCLHPVQSSFRYIDRLSSLEAIRILPMRCPGSRARFLLRLGLESRRVGENLVGVTTPFCVTRRPIDKTSPANLHIGGASVACSGITINLSALHIVNARQQFVFQQNVRYSAKLIHFRQNDWLFRKRFRLWFISIRLFGKTPFDNFVNPQNTSSKGKMLK